METYLESDNVTYDSIICRVTDDYLADADPDALPLDVGVELLTLTNQAIDDYNQTCAKGKRMRQLTKLDPYQMARVLVELHHAIRLYWLGFGDKDNSSLALYHGEGNDWGTYDISDTYISQVIRAYSPTYRKRDIEETILAATHIAPGCERTEDPGLIAVNNGVFDYRTKMLMDFDPELVFMSKSHVDYVAGAQNPNITMPDGEAWDVETWMTSLSDDPGVVNLLWQMIGAVIRPNERWDKAILMYATSGNNGKGTLCQLMRNICGVGTYASISVKDFGKEFMLAPLMRVSAVIVDENDTDSFLGSAEAFKAAVTHDVMRINIKMKEPKDIRFNGVIVECLNELPRFQDKSDSLYRRILPVPMTKSFTGIERKYIKSDYLNREDVLQYVLFRVLNMDYYEFDEPDACKGLLDEITENNDPLRQFLNEVMPRFAWNGVPWNLFYDFYVAWYFRCFNKKPSLGRNTFIKNVKGLLPNYPEWEVKEKFRSNTYITTTEPLFVEYRVESAFDPGYHGEDPGRKILIPQNQLFRGIVRNKFVTAAADGEDEE